MDERGFVDALLKSIKNLSSKAAYIRAVDKFTLGIPDILAWIPMPNSTPWMFAIEAKALAPLMPDPYHRGRRTGQMLKHPFTGPQISKLRELKAAGVEAFGLVRVSEDAAFRIEPEKINDRTGNFTHEELVEISTEVPRLADGTWRFWRSF